MIKDLVKCLYCNRVQLVKVGADSCPTCGEEGYLSWCDENVQKVDIDRIKIEPFIENGWKYRHVTGGTTLLYYPAIDKIIVKDEEGNYSLYNCNEEFFLNSNWNFTFEKRLSTEEVFCMTFKIKE